MTILDEIKAAVNETTRPTTRGRALYDLNIWLGNARKALNEEYEQRLAAIEAQEEPTTQDKVSPKVLELVAMARAQGKSRTDIRRALGLKTLDEADEVIDMAGGFLQEEIAEGKADAFVLIPTGQYHAQGWPIYDVNLIETGDSHTGIYLVTSGKTKEVQRRHLRISPSPAGSAEILDAVFASGAAAEMFARGKE